MQLGGGAPRGPRPQTTPEAVTRGASALGHRPAVSLLLPDGRQEQSGASLAQWAAKGAHLLQLDLLLEPGDEVRLAAPWSWTTAAVALAVWWAGGVVRLDATGSVHEAGIAVVGPDGDPGDAPDVFVLGDGIDGAPQVDRPGGHEAWTRAAQPFPDQPPPPRATPEMPAIRQGGRSFDHRAVLDLAAGRGEVGTLALEVGSSTGAPGVPRPQPPQDAVPETDAAPETDAVAEVDAATALALIALRPLLSGRPTVILRGVDRTAADGDRVTDWARTS
jgi:hypothetical protein